jgi:hypothetical protein
VIECNPSQTPVQQSLTSVLDLKARLCYKCKLGFQFKFLIICAEESHQLNALQCRCSVLFGAFDLDDYKETMGLSVIFIAYAFIGIIILLTVLDAVISALYEKSRQACKKLFGTAQLQFVAQYETLEEFLQPCADLFDHERNFKMAFCAIFCWFVLLSLVNSALLQNYSLLHWYQI